MGAGELRNGSDGPHRGEQGERSAARAGGIPCSDRLDMINGEAECSVLFHSVLVPPSKALAILLAIGVTLSSFMLGEEHD